jgi:hypothetical protein
MSAPGKPTEQARVLRRVAVAVAIACTIGVPGTGEAQRLQFTKLTADDGLSGPLGADRLPGQPRLHVVRHPPRARPVRRLRDHQLSERRGDTTSIPDNYIEFAREDRDSVLWIGTRKGLSRFDRAHDRFVTYRVGPGDEGRLVLSFLHTRAGQTLGRHR